jgi:hypothetical protein
MSEVHFYSCRCVKHYGENKIENKYHINEINYFNFFNMYLMCWGQKAWRFLCASDRMCEKKKRNVRCSQLPTVDCVTNRKEQGSRGTLAGGSRTGRISRPNRAVLFHNARLVTSSRASLVIQLFVGTRFLTEMLLKIQCYIRLCRIVIAILSCQMIVDNGC